MEFSFDVTKVLPADADGFVMLNGKDFYSKPTVYPSYSMQKHSNSSTETNLIQILDKMGAASSKAQGLKSIITDYSRFVTSDHRLYLKVDSNFVVGLIKVGEKNLFYHDTLGNVKELRPLCVLDFYVHESVQRMGVGKLLFEKMLEVENSAPYLIAYDRPSSKLLGFLKKYYGLTDFIPQNNNFVIFSQYFEKKVVGEQSSDKGSGRRDRSLPSSTQATNPITGGSIKKPAPEFYKGGRQGEIYPSGKIGARIENSDFPGEIEQSSQFQQLSQAYALNKKKQQPSIDPINHGFQSSWEDSSTQKYNKTFYENPESNSKRLTRGDRNLIDIQEKLKRTEEDIVKCKQKIEELSKQKNSQTVADESKLTNTETKEKEDTVGRVKFKQRIQELNNRSTPWATHHNIITQPSSSVYGSYLNKKY